MVCEVKPVQENSRRHAAVRQIDNLSVMLEYLFWQVCATGLCGHVVPSPPYMFFFLFFFCVCSIYPGCKSDSRDFHHISAFVVDLLIKEHYNVYTLLLQAMAFCFSAKSDA